MKKLLPIVLSLPILLAGCGGENSSPNAVSEKSSVTEQVENKKLSMSMNLDLTKLQSAGLAAGKIVVTLVKGDFTKTLEANHTDYFASVSFSNLVVGDYDISVQIFDGDTVVAEGVGTGTVSANTVATVNMNLELHSGGLVVNVNVLEPLLVENEHLTIEQIVTTTSPKLIKSDAIVSGAYGNNLARLYEDQTYTHEAAYPNFEQGSEILMDIGISYDVTQSNEIKPSSSGNNLTLKYNNATIVTCTLCDSNIQNNGNTLTITYNDMHLPQDVADSLVDSNGNKANAESIPGAQFFQQLDVAIIFTKIDGTDISTEGLDVTSLLDNTLYNTTLTINGTNTVDLQVTTGVLELGEMTASN